MVPLPLADLLPQDSTFYAVLMGVGFAVGIYAHAARFNRLLAFAIMWVFVTTVLTLVAARTYDGAPPNVNLP